MNRRSPSCSTASNGPWRRSSIGRRKRNSSRPEPRCFRVQQELTRRARRKLFGARSRAKSFLRNLLTDSERIGGPAIDQRGLVVPDFHPLVLALFHGMG